MNIYFNNPHNQVNPIKNKILEYIHNAKYEIDVAIYRFYDKDICNALIQFINKNINNNPKLYIVLDMNIEDVTSQEVFDTNIAQPIRELRKQYPQNVFIKIIEKKLMHHKMIIIDRHILGLGSYDYTISADGDNFESYVFLSAQQQPSIIHDALTEFYALMGMPFYAPPMQNISVKTLPSIVTNHRIYTLSYNDTDTFVFPTATKVVCQGNNILKIEIQTNYHQHTIYPTNNNNKHAAVFQLNHSQNIHITFYGWDGFSQTITKHITIQKYPAILSTKAFENFNAVSDYILQSFKTKLNN